MPALHLAHACCCSALSGLKAGRVEPAVGVALKACRWPRTLRTRRAEPAVGVARQAVYRPRALRTRRAEPAVNVARQAGCRLQVLRTRSTALRCWVLKRAARTETAAAVPVAAENRLRQPPLAARAVSRSDTCSRTAGSQPRSCLGLFAGRKSCARGGQSPQSASRVKPVADFKSCARVRPLCAIGS